jgi:UPF0755 protein
MRRAAVAIAAALVVAVAAGVWGARRYLDAPLAPLAADYVLTIAPGESLATVVQRLAADGIVDQPRLVLLWARLAGLASRIRAGEYLIPPGTSPRTLLERLVAGDVLLHSVTLVEGWTVREILDALAASPALAATLDTTDPGRLAAELKLPFPSAEGLFFPDTYRFPRATRDREVLRQAHAEMQRRLAAAWQDRAPGLPLRNEYELLILASIVEREAAVAAERPLIAGVFVRRLQQGMRLQADPTVIYGMGAAYQGNISRADLQRDTPFNTYTRTGLPPTPIGAPGAASLAAAARPAPGDALYFVATGRGDGSHRFSATLSEHNEAVRAYLAAQARARSKLSP